LCVRENGTPQAHRGSTIARIWSLRTDRQSVIKGRMLNREIKWRREWDPPKIFRNPRKHWLKHCLSKTSYWPCFEFPSQTGCFFLAKTAILGSRNASTSRTGSKTHFHTRRTKREYSTLPLVDEGRKRVLLIAASILAARKLAQFEGGKRVPATMSAIADAVRWAEEIMKAIDGRWPTDR
jgi:hypothetical protein